MLPFPIVLTALAGGAQAPSRDAVLAQPTVDVARSLLGDIASRFVTMTVERNGDVPIEVAFATASRGTGLPGLCEATVLRIFLWREEDRTLPPGIRSYSVDNVYKVVSEVDGPLGPLGPNEEEQQRACATAGPVLPAPQEGARASRFFRYNGYGPPWLAVAAVQNAIRDTRAGRHHPIECTRRELDDCRDPPAEFGALDVRNLESISVVQPDQEQPNFVVHASFVVEPGRTSSFGWRVSLDFNGEPLPMRRTRKVSFVYGRTRLFRY